MSLNPAKIDSSTKETVLKVQTMLKINFGSDYDQEKFDLLFTLLSEDGFSKSDLIKATKQFLKTKRYKNWTIADWYEILNENTEQMVSYNWLRDNAQTINMKDYIKTVPDADEYQKVWRKK